jgi:hypothetical protein
LPKVKLRQRGWVSLQTAPATTLGAHGFLLFTLSTVFAFGLSGNKV